eukprot:TRINITY_DN733_c0_g1_i6.p1 TRINITY_DN733_c0_g1~~TRINITY_DN733_c0_g1_i6.p1  ORF type:complete len:795 (-),score=160.89 TRINITY_DN733_c0_g1_i6:1098-3482(-)
MCDNNQTNVAATLIQIVGREESGDFGKPLIFSYKAAMMNSTIRNIILEKQKNNEQYDVIHVDAIDHHSLTTIHKFCHSQQDAQIQQHDLNNSNQDFLKSIGSSGSLESILKASIILENQSLTDLIRRHSDLDGDFATPPNSSHHPIDSRETDITIEDTISTVPTPQKNENKEDHSNRPSIDFNFDYTHQSNTEKKEESNSNAVFKNQNEVERNFEKNLDLQEINIDNKNDVLLTSFKDNKFQGSPNDEIVDDSIEKDGTTSQPTELIIHEIKNYESSDNNQYNNQNNQGGDDNQENNHNNNNNNNNTNNHNSVPGGSNNINNNNDDDDESDGYSSNHNFGDDHHCMNDIEPFLPTSSSSEHEDVDSYTSGPYQRWDDFGNNDDDENDGGHNNNNEDDGGDQNDDRVDSDDDGSFLTATTSPLDSQDVQEASETRSATSPFTPTQSVLKPILTEQMCEVSLKEEDGESNTSEPAIIINKQNNEKTNLFQSLEEVEIELANTSQQKTDVQSGQNVLQSELIQQISEIQLREVSFTEKVQLPTQKILSLSDDDDDDDDAQNISDGSEEIEFLEDENKKLSVSKYSLLDSIKVSFESGDICQDEIQIEEIIEQLSKKKIEDQDTKPSAVSSEDQNLDQKENTVTQENIVDDSYEKEIEFLDAENQKLSVSKYPQLDSMKVSVESGDICRDEIQIEKIIEQLSEKEVEKHDTDPSNVQREDQNVDKENTVTQKNIVDDNNFQKDDECDSKLSLQILQEKNEELQQQENDQDEVESMLLQKQEKKCFCDFNFCCKSETIE